jgi:PAS domain S-box-containing protein
VSVRRLFVDRDDEWPGPPVLDRRRFPSARFPGAKILVVDDFEDGRVVASTFLRHAGFEVVEAVNGTQALALAAEGPDLVLLDINLPDIDGFEVCRRLKGSPATAVIPIVHLSAAHREIDDRVQGLEGGADAYLTLPVRSEELIATVNSVLRIHRAEAELRKSQERYRRLIDTALEGVWTLDATATTTYVNQQMAAMLGQSAEAMLGRPLWDFVDGASLADAEAHFARTRQGLKEQFDLRFRRADGSELWAIVSTHPLAEGDRFAGALILVTDVTDRKRADKAEREAEALRSVASLAETTSHEINNPLMAVMGNLELLGRNPSLDAKAQGFVRRSLEAAEDIKAKVRRMAHITRLEFADGGVNLPPMLDLRRSSPEGEKPAAPGDADHPGRTSAE